MSTKISCPNGHSLKVADDAVGKSGKCPKCGVVFQVVVADPFTDNAPFVDPVGITFEDVSANPFDFPADLPPLESGPTASAFPAFPSPSATPATAASAAPENQSSPGKVTGSPSPANKLPVSQQVIAICAGVLVAILVMTGFGIWLFGGTGTQTVSLDSHQPRNEDQRVDPPAEPSSIESQFPVESHSEASTAAPTVEEDGTMQAPKSDSPGIRLLESADYFAMDVETGELAAVQRNSQNLYLYSAQYLTTGSGPVRGPIDVGRSPGPIVLKKLRDRSLYIVADMNDFFLRCFDTKTLELVHTIRSPCRYNTGLSASLDPDDERVFFCTNPYPPNTTGDWQYFICAGDLRSSNTAKRVFFADSEEPHDCYVSPAQGFLYGRKYRYPFAAFLEQGSLDSITENSNILRAPHKTQFEHLVIDPGGASVALQGSLYSPDMQSTFHKYDFAVQCYLQNRPCVAGCYFQRDSKDLTIGLSMKIAGLDSAETLAEIPTDFQEIPSGLNWVNLKHINRFLTEGRAFHSLVNDSIVVAFRDTTLSIPLGDVNLPTGPSPLPTLVYPSRIRLGESLNVHLTVPADPEAVFEIPDLPNGATVSEGIFSWTPDPTQTGIAKIPVRWSSGDREGQIDIRVFVDDAEGALAADLDFYRKHRGLAQPDRAAKSGPPDEKVSSDARGENVFIASFPIDEVHATWDGTAMLGLGWEDPGAAKSRPDHAVTRCAVIDLKTGEVEAETEIPFCVHSAAIDDHHVYLKGKNASRGAPVIVLSRPDLARKTTLHCANNSHFGAFAGKIFVATNVHSVPSLEILRTDPRPQNQPFGRLNPPIVLGEMKKFYDRNPDGWVINGIQYDHTRGKVLSVGAVDALGELRFVSQIYRAVNPPENPHPILPVNFVTQFSSSSESVRVYPNRRTGPEPIREYPLAGHRGRFSSRMHVDEDFLLVPVGGSVHRVDISDLKTLSIGSEPRIVATQSAILIDPDKPTTLQYKIVGGRPPFTAASLDSNLVKRDVTVNGDTLEAQVKYSDWYEETSKRWLGDRWKAIRESEDFEQMLTGFPPVRMNEVDPEFDRLIRELREFCSNRLKIPVPRNSVPVPVPASVSARDQNGTEFQFAHWLFLNVKETDYRNEVKGTRK